MSPRHNSPFLERQSYRRRRLIDTIRFLPVIGAILWSVPLLWPTQEEAEASAVKAISSSDAIIYIFLVWFGLVVFGAWCAYRMKQSNALEEDKGR